MISFGCSCCLGAVQSASTSGNVVIPSSCPGSWPSALAICLGTTSRYSIKALRFTQTKTQTTHYDAFALHIYHPRPSALAE